MVYIRVYINPKTLDLQVHEWVQAHGGEPIIPFSAAFESRIFDMPDDERAAYCKEVPGVFRLFV